MVSIDPYPGVPGGYRLSISEYDALDWEAHAREVSIAEGIDLLVLNDDRDVDVGDNAGIGSINPAPCSEVLPQRKNDVNLFGDFGFVVSSMNPKPSPPSDMFGCMGTIGVYADADALRVVIE